MKTRRQRRMAAVAVLVLGLSAATALGVTAFRRNMMYFYTPSDLVAATAPAGARLRLGGLVERGSVVRAEGLTVRFTLADCAKSVKVRYDGILPDLFREGQGIVATGRMTGDEFVADEVLAKHDENYMPPQLAESLKTESGHSCAEFMPVSSRDSGLGTRDSGMATDPTAVIIVGAETTRDWNPHIADLPESRVPSPESRRTGVAIA